MENRSRLLSNWNATKRKLKEKFQFLSEDDLFLQAGEQEELLARLEAKLGINKQKLLLFITNL